MSLSEIFSSMIRGEHEHSRNAREFFQWCSTCQCMTVWMEWTGRNGKRSVICERCGGETLDPRTN